MRDRERSVAGTGLDEALVVTPDLMRQGLDVSRGMVGESVTDLTESERATKTNGDAVKAVPTPVAGSCRPVDDIAQNEMLRLSGDANSYALTLSIFPFGTGAINGEPSVS
jgi:hypothetical protein